MKQTETNHDFGINFSNTDELIEQQRGGVKTYLAAPAVFAVFNLIFSGIIRIRIQVTVASLNTDSLAATLHLPSV